MTCLATYEKKYLNCVMYTVQESYKVNKIRLNTTTKERKAELNHGEKDTHGSENFLDAKKKNIAKYKRGFWTCFTKRDALSKYALAFQILSKLSGWFWPL